MAFERVNTTSNTEMIMRVTKDHELQPILNRSASTHRLIVYPPIRVEKTKDKREDIRRTTQLLSDFIEEHVRNFPEEWFWLHDRWKSMREEF